MANLSIVRELCKEKNISLKKLGEEIGIKTPQGVQRMINENSTTIDRLERIAKLLDVPIWHFFDLDPEKKFKASILECENKVIELNKTINDLKLDLNKWETSFNARDDEVNFLTEKYNTLEKLFKEKSAIVEEYKDLIKNLKGLTDTDANR